MDLSKKILSFEDASGIIDRIRKQGERVVQCHGTFDLIHPGHIIHFEEAKRLGDVLVVTVTAAEFVNKGPGRPCFSDELRLRSLAALACIDYVVLVPHPAAVEAIECVRPHIYCKGKEYQDPSVDVTGNIADDILTVQKYDGRMAYVGEVAFSSTKLLNRFFENHTNGVKAYCQSVQQMADAPTIRTMVEDFSRLRVLIIGDIIFDQYVSVVVQGLTSKNRILSSRHLGQDMQAGGALAGYRHVRQFTEHVKIIGLLGQEPWVNNELGTHLDTPGDALVRDARLTTIVKQRFVEPVRDGKELSKLFSVNYLDEHPPLPEIEEVLIKAAQDHISSADLVLAMDFGHGVFSSRMRELVQGAKCFLALNCQTNSNNHGFNIINRRYSRTDMFSLDQRELHLACGRKHLDYLADLSHLRSSFGASYAWLTRGSYETFGVQGTDQQTKCPVFEHNVVDTVGAGDAFFAVAAMAARTGMPLEIATFLGQLAGAQAVRIVGNSRSIRKADILKAVEGMLKM